MKFPALSLAAALFVACAPEPAPLAAGDVVVSRPIPGTGVAAAYLTLSNNTAQPIAITRVESPDFESVEMHESVLEQGIARMYPIGELTILSHTTVAFERGGRHLMLMRPIGDPDLVTLEFFAGKALVLTVSVALTD